MTKITIEFDPAVGQFAMTSDATNFETLGLLEVAKHAMIKKGMEGPGMPGFQVRRADGT